MILELSSLNSGTKKEGQLNAKEHAFSKELNVKMQEFADFLKQHDKLVICHHVDADGLTSLLLLMHWMAQLHNTTLEEIQSKIKTFAINNGDRKLEPSQYAQLSDLRDQGFSAMAFVDLNPRDQAQLTQLQGDGWHLANVDHHSADTTQDGILITNPVLAPELATNKELLRQFSTSSAIWQYGTSLTNNTLLDPDQNLLQIARVGNKGDDSVFLNNFGLKPSDDEQRTINKLASILNILGTSEWYNITPEERDVYIASLFKSLLNAEDLTSAIDNLSQDGKYEDILQNINTITDEIKAIALDKNNQEKIFEFSSFTIEVNIESEKKLLICRFKPDEKLDVTALLVKSCYDFLNNQDLSLGETSIAMIQPARDGEITMTLCSNRDSTQAGLLMQEMGKLFGKGGGGHNRRAGATILSEQEPLAMLFLKEKILNAHS